MKEAGCAIAPKVWSLNYHEVTADPRVLKQARALSASGYDVTVFCDHPKDKLKCEDANGVKIHRFDWTSLEFQISDINATFDFLSATCSDVLSAFHQLSCLIQDRRELLRSLLEIDSSLEQLKRSYYKKYAGAERARRKREHLKARLLTAARGVFDKRYRTLDSTVKRIDTLRKDIALRFRDLHQAKGLVFAANLLEEDLGHGPSVIHAHDLYTLPAGVVLARHYGCRLVYDAHELEIERASDLGSQNKDMVDRLERACLEHVDALITVSDSIGEVYSQRFPRKQPVIVMNAPEISLDEAARSVTNDLRSQTGLGDDVPLVVFTGGIQREHRGVDKVLEALIFLEDVHLATLGPRHARNDEWFRHAAARLGVAERVHMLDPVDAKDVVPVISTASVSVIPFQAGPLNHEFAMPNKLFEAAFARVPLVVSNLKEMRNFVESLQIGRYMDQTDPKSIAEAIRHVLNNLQDYSGGKDLERRLSQDYSWTAQVGELEGLYDELLVRV